MLKSTSIHNAERLTHFLTSQVEYVNDVNCLIDQFPKQPVYLLKSSRFQLSINDVTSHVSFLNLCFQKVIELHTVLSCDHIVEGLDQSSGNNNSNIRPLFKIQDMPSERILSIEINNSLFPLTTTVYLTIEKLCSSEINDIRISLDLTSQDYDLNELHYLPFVACSPLVFASQHINSWLLSIDNDASSSHDQKPHPYSLPWGFLEFSTI